MPDSYERRYQVFVSSTFRDLQDERQKVLQAILELHAFPSGMELFPSADEEQWEFIQREIASSDYYVLVIAGKYGSLAPDGVSFTEKEYDYAVSISKPVMTFLYKDLDELKGSQLEQDADKRTKLQAFRTKVSQSRLVRFYNNADELKAQVWQSLSHSFQMRPQAGWMRATNQRRLEDLEEINRLQKTVHELEAQLNALRSEVENDPAAKLARGDDPVTWEVQVQTRVAGEPTIQQFEKLPWRTSWSQLLIAFHDPEAQWREAGEVEASLRKACLASMDQAKPLADASLSYDVPREEIDKVFDAVVIQFKGLGYVEQNDQPLNRDRIAYPGYRSEMKFRLTPKGATQAALVLGRQR